MELAHHESLRDSLFLACLPNMAPRHWQRVLDAFTEPRDLLTQPASVLQALRLPKPARAAILGRQGGEKAVEPHPSMLATLQRHDIQGIAWHDPAYPEPLRHIHGPPPLLFVRGQSALLQRRCIAIIGSRRVSRDGLDHARRFAGELAQQGFCVVSGLALGADTAAHQGALAADGDTIAVLAGGVERVYPRRNQSLEPQLLAQGALVSEMPPGTDNRPELFPRRNRIISGLCEGVLVVEAGLRSGTLITARLALEQGREVFAIPGSIRNPLARGCHALIRDGACLVESSEDIVDELGGASVLSEPASSDTEETPSSLASEANHLLQALSWDPQTTDTLSIRSGMAPEQLVQQLLELELAGLVEQTAGGYRRRAG